MRHRRIWRAVFSVTVGLAMLPFSARANAEPPPGTFVLTLAGPADATAVEPITLSGSLTLRGSGIAGQTVDLMVDGVKAGETTTALDGSYSVELVMPRIGVVEVHAVAFRATAEDPLVAGSQRLLETMSSPIVITVVESMGELDRGYPRCGVMDDGTARCWEGPLGDGTARTQTAPSTVLTYAGPQPTPLRGVRSVASATHTSCAITVDGSLYCWDDGTYGFGRTASHVASIPQSAITAGAGHHCMIGGDGVARCWGDNTYGQLGNGSAAAFTFPGDMTPVADLPGGVARISADTRHSCAVTHGGDAYCWGSNTRGELGTGSVSTVERRARRVALAWAVRDIAPGRVHACALKTDGTVWCWGQNALGQLGDGTFDDSLVPRQVLGLTGVVSLSVGQDHTCALQASGSVACWGSNALGAVGVGEGTERYRTPVETLPAGSAIDVSVSDRRSCVVTEQRRPMCWGNGQLQPTLIAWS